MFAAFLLWYLLDKCSEYRELANRHDGLTGAQADRVQVANEDSTRV